jgi:methionyl-tRNA formyltransferase
LVHRKADVGDGDLLFLISCSELVEAAVRARFAHTLVIHAADLPRGRGWSPHIWEILGGADRLTVTLLTAEDAVDSGAIWRKLSIPLSGTELYDEINAKLFEAELELMSWALKNFGCVRPEPQSGEPSYDPKRRPADSEVDPQRPLSEIFDLLRVADPARFPAFFYYRGRGYAIRIEPLERDS